MMGSTPYLRALPAWALLGVTLSASSGAQVLPSSSAGQVVSRMFAGTSSGPYVTYSWGEQWFRLRGDTRGFEESLDVFACLGPTVFAGGEDGLYVSEDYGETFSKMPRFPGVDVTRIVTARLFELEPTLLVGTRSGLFRSTDRGLHWDRLAAGSFDGVIYDLSWPGPELFAATDSGLYLSDDLGDTWKRLDRGLPEAPVLSVVVSQYFAADPTIVVGTSKQGLYRSTDGGDSFEPTGGKQRSSASIQTMFWWGTVLLIGADDGLYFSDDGGLGLRAVPELEGRSVLSLCVPAPEGLSQSDILVGTDQGVYKSSDGGWKFLSIDNGLGRPQVTHISTFPMPPAIRERGR